MSTTIANQRRTSMLLSEFLAATGLPDLPAQPEELWNEQTYPAGTMPDGEWRKVRVQTFSNGSFGIKQICPLGGGSEGADCSIEGNVRFSGAGQEPRVSIDEVSYYPRARHYLGAKDVDDPDQQQFSAVAQAFYRAMNGTPIGAPGNEWEDIESGKNTKDFEARKAASGAGSSSPAPDIMGTVRRACGG